MTVVAAPRTASAPASGKGVQKVSGGCGAVLNLAGTALTVYGTAADTCSVQVFSRPQPPSFGKVT
jgi:hypothetical protein